MFTTYEYRAGTTAANLLNDVVLLLTGTTDKATLSADCVQASTEIISTVASGWELWDADAGTNKKCVRAPIVNSIYYKYVVIDTNTTGCIMQTAYENWNATTHIGTNMINDSNSTNSNQRVGLTNGGFIRIASSSKFMGLHGNTLGVYGAVGNSGSGFTLVIERSRLAAWDTDASYYPPFIFTSNGALEGTGYQHFSPRKRNVTQAGGGDLLNAQSNWQGNIYMGGGMAGGLLTNAISSSMGRDANFNLVHLMHPIYIASDNYGPHMGESY